MHPDFALHPAGPGPLIDDPAEQAGFTSWQQDAAGQRIAESHFALSGLYCAACADVIEHALRAEPLQFMLQRKVAADASAEALKALQEDPAAVHYDAESQAYFVDI